MLPYSPMWSPVGGMGTETHPAITNNTGSRSVAFTLALSFPLCGCGFRGRQAGRHGVYLLPRLPPS